MPWHKYNCHSLTLINYLVTKTVQQQWLKWMVFSSSCDLNMVATMGGTTQMYNTTFFTLGHWYRAEHVSGAERWEFPLPAHVGVRSPRSTAQSRSRPLRSIQLPAHLQFHPAPVKSLHARSHLKFLCMPNTCRFQPKPWAGAAPENFERRCWGGARSMTGSWAINSKYDQNRLLLLLFLYE